MFQQAVEYNVQMNFYFFRPFYLEIKNKQIVKKERSVQNLHGILEKEQKLKVELQVRNNGNNQVLVEL
jgi:hypothetical protein